MTRGIYVTLGVMAAARVIDLAVSMLACGLTFAGLRPDHGVLLAISVRAVLGLLALAGKGLLLVALVRAPQRLDWMARSWAPAITLAVLAILSVPAMQGLATLEQIMLVRSDSLGSIASWFYARTILGMVLSYSTAALWGAALLFSYGRLRTDR